MARDFIKVDTATSTATHSRELLRYKDLLRQAYDQGKKVLGIMSHNQDGANFADIEALFGLPPTKGQTVFDMVNGSVGSMEGVFMIDDVKKLIERVG